MRLSLGVHIAPKCCTMSIHVSHASDLLKISIETPQAWVYC